MLNTHSCGCKEEIGPKKCGGPDCACFRKHRQQVIAEVVIDLATLEGEIDREKANEIANLIVQTAVNIYNPDSTGEGRFLSKLCKVHSPTLAEEKRIDWEELESRTESIFAGGYLAHSIWKDKTKHGNTIANIQRMISEDTCLIRFSMVGVRELINILQEVINVNR